MRVDGGGLEAEVGVVFGDFFVNGRMMDGDGDEGDLGAHGGAGGEEATVDVFEGGGGDDVVVSGDELDADVVEGERVIGVVGDDDTDGDEAVLDIGEAEEVAEFGVEAGICGDGDVLVGMSIEVDVLIGGLDGRCGLFFVGGVGERCAEDGGGQGEGANDEAGWDGHAH